MDKKIVEDVFFDLIFASEKTIIHELKIKIMKKNHSTMAICTFMVLTVVYLVYVFAFKQNP